MQYRGREANCKWLMWRDFADGGGASPQARGRLTRQVAQNGRNGCVI